MWRETAGSSSLVSDGEEEDWVSEGFTRASGEDREGFYVVSCACSLEEPLLAGLSQEMRDFDTDQQQ